MHLRSRRDLLTLRPCEGEPRSCVHIASLLVHAVPERIEAARSAMSAFPGAELHATAHRGKFVVVLECAEERAVARCVDELHATPGVLTVSVVSHLVEDANALDEEINDVGEPSTVSEA